jgi:diguanylate cyclase (GGDEF)-like protein
MRTAIRLSWWSDLSVRARLFAIVGLFGASLAVVGILAISALGHQARAMEELANVNVQQQLTLDAGTRQEVLRSRVFAAVYSYADAGDPADAVANLRGLGEDSRALLDEMESLVRLAGGADDVAAVQRSRAATAIYVATAGEIATLAGRDRPAAVARLSEFESMSHALGTALDAQTDLIKARLATADQLAQHANVMARTRITSAVILLSIIVTLIVWALARSIRRSLGAMRDVAAAMADGDLSVRTEVTSPDEVGELAQAIDRMGGSLGEMIARLRADADRDAFSTQLGEALEMVDTEEAVYGTVTRAMQLVVADRPMELLLSDSSRAQLERAAQHPLAGAPGCGVESPFDCVAVRRGSRVAFADSDALNACPHLRSRPGGPLGALCVPVSFMGRALGVLHTTGPVLEPPTREQIARLAALGVQAGNRIGTVRAFERTQIQAATDSLTGLANRRALEEIVRQLGARRQGYAFVMADLDQFKKLNDTYGHGVGDNSLRQFADVLRRVVRAGDHVARWGGEEFAIVMPGASAVAALEVLERLRQELAAAVGAAGSRPFTASFGIADSTMATRFDHLVRIADDALYRSKEAGRDRATVGDPAVAHAAKPRRDFEQTARLDVTALVRSA